jgi:hypothetical protein
MIRMSVLSAALLLATAAATIADEAHHPPETATPAAPPSAAAPAPTAPPAPRAQPGMMGPGMGRGMMGPGMMGLVGGMMAPKRIEGRIAFLRTELRITEAQQPHWNAFADALRANARVAAGMMASMPGRDDAQHALPQRLEAQERMLAARLDSFRQLRAALTPLYDVLDDAQKRAADELLAPGPMGIM